MTKLDQECFTVWDGKVEQGTLADFSHFIETTTRPHGVGYKYYATTVSRRNESDTDDDGNEVLPEEVFRDQWVLAKWATWCGPEVVVLEFESEDEASAAAEDSYVYDILHNSEFPIYLDRQSAEADLADWIASEE